MKFYPYSLLVNKNEMIYRIMLYLWWKTIIMYSATN